MKSPLRIVHLEEDPKDAALVQSALEADGIPCAITCVHQREDFVAALEREDVDLVLSDFSLPGFDGLSAAELVRAKWPAIPIILVSGTLGEERVIDSIKSGATDFVSKERLGRLVPAVRRAMLEVEGRAGRRRLEAQFIEAQKMEAIGQLAGGVAHDFNNILSIIMSCSDLISSGLDPLSPLQKYTVTIRNASERAAALTRQLLVFSRKKAVLPIVLDLNQVAKELEKMLRPLIDENITLTMRPGNRTGQVRADPGYVGQVLMNLAVNARDAMPNGGQLTIGTMNVTLDERQAGTQPGTTPGDYVMLSVSDTGTGMTDEVKSHLFEAFFTTKPKGKGTGLGLSTCQTIVQQSGGHIGVFSEMGKGTTFKVYFPRVAEPLDPAPPIPRGPLPRGTETLLVVEDEASLRHLTCVVLKAQGYALLSAANGQEGLEIARNHHGAPIRLIVTDVIMPLMGGKVMADSLKLTHPDIKILFTSGYTDEAVKINGELDTGVDFLPKPFTQATLARKVRELLDEPVAST